MLIIIYLKVYFNIFVETKDLYNFIEIFKFMNKKMFKLLYELDQDSRRSLSQISKKVHMSEQVISYNLTNFKKKKIISNFFTVLDISKLNYTSYCLMIQLTKTNQDKFNEIISYFKNYPNLLWLAKCGGRFDLIIDIMAKNIIDFDNQLITIRTKFSNQIQNYTILTIIDVLHFGRNYLIDKKREIKQKIPSFEKKLSLVNIDKIDKKILEKISEDGRIPLLDIAKKLKLSGNTISNRIKKMKKIGLIQGFKPLINLDKIYIESYKIIIKLQNITLDKEKKIKSFAHSDSRIVFLVKTVGEWDIELEIEVKSREELQKMIMKLRDSFPEMIKEIETIPIYQDYRYNYFPRKIMKD